MADLLKERERAAIEKSEAIDGWLTPSEAGALFDLSASSDAPIVEIGSWQGRSTAAIALGSMAGKQQEIYAIDSFKGVPPLNRVSAKGNSPGWNTSTPQLLRANLDAAGVNGLVRIIAKPSAEAAPYIPECGLVFIDGDHGYEAVRRDLDLYLPKLKQRGYVALHDCINEEPTVVKAVDDCLMTRPKEWRLCKRVDSIVIFQKRETISHAIRIGVPGGKLHYGTAAGLLQATLGGHDISLDQSGLGWDDMNNLWVNALNAAAKGQISHFAMLHSDICPSAGWVDVLANELDDLNGDLISVVNAMKDHRGLSSCAIGDCENPWAPLRRLTIRELQELPETFDIVDTPHPDRYLLHNSGCWLADLRKSLWRTTDADGRLEAVFAFPIQARLLANGTFCHQRESEDWYFSRKIAGLGAKTYATRKVETVHIGDKGFINSHPWGTYKEGDEETKERWQCQVS